MYTAPHPAFAGCVGGNRNGVRCAPARLRADPVGAPSGDGREACRRVGSAAFSPVGLRIRSLRQGSSVFRVRPYVRSFATGKTVRPLCALCCFCFLSVFSVCLPLFLSSLRYFGHFGHFGLSSVFRPLFGFVFLFGRISRFCSLPCRRVFVSDLRFSVLFPARRSYSEANTEKGGKPICSFAPSRHPPSALSG